MGTPKNGLAKLMRAWMREQKNVSTTQMLYAGLGLPPGKARWRAKCALDDFCKRGEVERVSRGRFRYNHAWKRKTNAPLRDKIVKAMYVSGKEFSQREIRQRAETRDKGYVHTIIHQLISGGYLRQVGKRQRIKRGRLEKLYQIKNRERFRIEVMD